MVLAKRSFNWGYLVFGLLFLLVLLAVLFWPKLQAMVLPSTATPTLASTDILQPTQTSLPSATATETLMPSATPTTGTVSGQVMWGDQPYGEGVNLQLCADPVFTGSCKSLTAEEVTDAQGKFTFSQVQPGKYTLVPYAPGDLGLMIEKDVIEIVVSAGETQVLTPFDMCKYNFKAYTPVLNKNNSLTLRWSTYPSNEYTWYFGDIYATGGGEHHVHYTSTTIGSIDPGSYVFYVRASGYAGTGSSCSISWFTIP